MTSEQEHNPQPVHFFHPIFELSDNKCKFSPGESKTDSKLCIGIFCFECIVDLELHEKKIMKCSSLKSAGYKIPSPNQKPQMLGGQNFVQRQQNFADFQSTDMHTKLSHPQGQ